MNTQAVLNYLSGSTAKGLDGKTYILRKAIDLVTGQKQIAKILCEDDSLCSLTTKEKENFATRILQRPARKLFAISVYSGLNGQCLQILLDWGLTDKHLPLGNDCACPNTYYAFQFRRFMEYQYAFLAPSFDEPQKHYTFGDDVCVPVAYTSQDVIDIGANSTVYRVKIDSDQHRLIEVVVHSYTFPLPY
jgi:hypothetical protein